MSDNVIDLDAIPTREPTNHERIMFAVAEAIGDGSVASLYAGAQVATEICERHGIDPEQVR